MAIIADVVAIPSLSGRSILITGANTGIGRATALALGRAGATLYLAGRSEERYREVLDELRATGARGEFLPLDLGELASVRECAARFVSLGAPLHVLINNAGVAGLHGLTKDGFEVAFGVNYLGHFLLTELLLERLVSSAPSRVVNVSSKAHYDVRALDWEALRRPTATSTGLREYSVSKLCNVLHANELAERLRGKGVSTHSLHPGVVASDVWRHVPWGLRHVMRLFMSSNAEGARTSIHCAASEAAASQSGLYYDDGAPKAPSALAGNAALARELAQKSRAWTAG